MENNLNKNIHQHNQQNCCEENHQLVCEHLSHKKCQKISKKDRFIMSVLTLVLGYFFLKPILTYSLFINALSYEQAGMVEEAIVKLNKSIKIFPEFAASYTHLANIYESQNLQSKALKFYKKAATLDADDWFTYQGMATILLKKRNFKKIVKELYFLIDKENLTVNYVLTLKILAVACEKTNEPKKALKVWKKVYLLQPKDMQAMQKVKQSL